MKQRRVSTPSNKRRIDFSNYSAPPSLHIIRLLLHFSPLFLREKLLAETGTSSHQEMTSGYIFETSEIPCQRDAGRFWSKEYLLFLVEPPRFRPDERLMQIDFRRCTQSEFVLLPAFPGHGFESLRLIR